MAITLDINALKKPKPLPGMTDPAAPGTVQNVPQAPGSGVPEIQPMQPPPGPQPDPNLNQKVLKTAQNTALNQQPGATLQKTTELTQDFMNEQAPDYAKTKQTQLEAFDVNRAKQLEALRQQTADVSNTGLNLENLTGFALQGVRDRSTLDNELDTTAADQRRQDALAKIGQGQSTAQLEENTRNQAFQNLLNTVGAAEPGEQRQFQAAIQQSQQGFDAAMKNLDIQGQQDLAKLQGNIQKGLTLTQQDFDAAQKALDRAQQAALQSGDIQGQKDIESLRQVFQSQQLVSQQSFARESQVMDQTFQSAMKTMDVQGQKELTELKGKIDSGMMVTQQDFDAMQSSLDRAQQTALQSGDVQGQKDIEAMRQSFQAAQQASDQNFQVNLKTMDTQSQKDIMELKNKLDTGTLMTQQDFQAAQAGLDRELQKAMDTNDTGRQVMLLNMKQDFDAKQTKAQQDYNTGERVATQSWQTGEKLSDQDFQKGQAYFDRETNTLLAKQQITAEMDQQLAGFTQEEKMVNLKAAIDEAAASGDTERQKALMGYQNTLDLGKMTAGFTHDEQMANLDAALAEAKASGDVDRQKSIMGFQQIIDQASTLQEQGFLKDQAEYDAYIKQTMQTSDQAAQKVLEDGKNQLALAMQMNDMNHEDKLTYLNAQLEEAKAKNDFTRTGQLQQMSASLDWNKMLAEQGYDAAQADLNRKQEMALQNGDTDQAVLLARMGFEQQSKEGDKNRAIDQARVQLESKGLDMQKIQNQYEMISAAEEAGTAQPGSAVDYLNQQLSGSGVTIAKTGPQDQAAAILKEYDNTRMQYLLSHKDLIAGNGSGQVSANLVAAYKAANPTVQPTAAGMISWALGPGARPDLLTLTADGEKDFNNNLNTTVYGENTMKESIKTEADVKTATKDFTSDPALLAGKKAGDPDFDAVVASLPNGSTEYISTATAGTWMVRDYGGMKQPLKLVSKKVAAPKGSIMPVLPNTVMFETVDGTQHAFNTSSRTWTS